MKRILLLFFIILSYTFASAQSDSCDMFIPEICASASLQSYPASTTGTAWAPGASFACPGTQPITMNPAFFFFEIGATGDFSMTIDPIDPFNGSLLSTPSDLDYICWGPFSSMTNVCSQLQAPNRFDCSYSSAVSEVVTIPNAQAGDFYILLVSNWAQGTNTPPDANLEFTATTTAVGMNPLGGGGFAGADAQITACSTDNPFNLTNQLNGFPDDWGYWVDSISGNIVDTIFNPATDQGGVYMYIIPDVNDCGGDTAWLDINIFNASSISITSTPNACSDDGSLTLTASPTGGVFSGTDVTGNTFTPSASNIGVNTISYEYTANGCAPIIVTQNLTVNESPTVLPANVITTNPTCFGYCDGAAIITATLGTPTYTYNWFGEDPLALCSGTFNYTVTDDNGCTFSSDVTLYDPQNNLGVLNSYPSFCYGDNNGSIGVTLNAAATPPGTVSTLAYCASHPNPDFIAQPATSIEEVILVGDNVNINKNTVGMTDHYEDYTTTDYADITEGQSYTINVTLQDLSGFGAYLGGARVFIDFNIDGDFLDAGEAVGIVPSPSAPGLSVPIAFTVPTTGAFGPTRMRVVAQDQFNITTSNDIGPCDAPLSGSNGAPWFGATEDYSIVLSAPAVTASFLWNNGQTLDSITNLSPGDYIVTITPSNGCSVQDTATVTEPAQIIFSPSVTDISCNTFSDGQISLSPSGGNGGPYTIEWGTTNPLALNDGAYSVTVTDPSTITATNLIACENDTIIVMVEPEYFSVDFTTSSNEICLNDPTTLNFDFNQGGIPNFTVNYTENGVAQSAGPFTSTGQQQVSISPNVGNNTYIITSITDDGGCVNQNTINSEDIYVNPIPDINIAVAPNPICVGDNATLLFSTPNGTPPYVVDYLSGSTSLTENVPGAGSSVIVNPTNTTTYSLTYVTDSKGCTANLSDNVTLVVNEIPQVTLSSPSETCDNDIIQLKFNFTAGTSPWMVTYDINGTGTTIPIFNATDSIAISPSSTTVYTINSVTDNNNCTNNMAQTLTITTNPLPEIVLSGGGSICADGSTAEIVFTTTSGTPPYNLTYSAGLNSNFVSNIGSIYTTNTDQAGVYTIQSVSDSKGCEATSIIGSAFVNINPLPNANISAYPQPVDILNPLVNFIDLSSGHTYGEWNFDDGNTAISNLGEINHTFGDTGTYQVSLSVESDSSCVDIAWQTIIVSPVFTVYIPNAFTPNNDLKNDLFLPVVDGVDEYEFSVYDRLGHRVFRTDKTNIGWDGKVNDGSEYATKGVYVYALVLTDINGKLRTYEGTVTLIR